MRVVDESHGKKVGDNKITEWPIREQRRAICHIRFGPLDLEGGWDRNSGEDAWELAVCVSACTRKSECDERLADALRVFDGDAG